MLVYPEMCDTLKIYDSTGRLDVHGISEVGLILLNIILMLFCVRV